MTSELRALWEQAGGQVPDHWSVVTLESLLRDSKSIAVGVMYPGPHTDGGVPLIKVGDISGGALRKRPEYCISSETNHEYRRTQLDGDELLITLVGNPGECVVVTGAMRGWNPARAIAVVRFRDSSLRTYIKAVLESSAGKHLIDAVLNTTVQKTLNLKDVRQLPIPMPSRREIDEISTVSNALTERITLLRETNATLEAISQGLFKSWFVDFDPVRTKSQGLAPAGMDETTAALFPDSFEAAGAMILPRGWKVSPVYEMATYINGAAYKAFEPNADRRGMPIIKIAELKAGVTTQTAFSAVEMPQKYLIGTGDILFSWSGNPDTSIDTFVWAHEPAWLNQHIFRVLPKASTERAFVLELLRYLRPVFAELARNKQTTGLGHVTVADLKRLVVTRPTVELLSAFDAVAGPIHSRTLANQQQARTLAAVRDTLLPRLISGQLRLPEAETQITNAIA